MSQLYARVFLQILDSSLAEDWKTRHVFEDILKLVNRDGVCDMTHAAIARRTNVPLEVVAAAIGKLESPDKNSRDSEYEGRRLIRLDDHRDWGWRVANWDKYDAVKNDAEHRAWKSKEMANYRSRLRARKGTPSSSPTPPPTPPEAYTDTEVGSTCRPTVDLPVDLHVVYKSGTQPDKTDVCVVDRPIEPPRGFPSSEAEARESAALCSVPEDFAAKCWNLAASRGFLDARGQQIRSWRHYAASCWAFERDRVSRQRAGQSGGSNGKQVPQAHRDGRPRSIAMETLREVEAKMRAMGDLP